jgi:hypothetical protein
MQNGDSAFKNTLQPDNSYCYLFIKESNTIEPYLLNIDLDKKQLKLTGKLTREILEGEYSGLEYSKHFYSSLSKLTSGENKQNNKNIEVNLYSKNHVYINEKVIIFGYISKIIDKYLIYSGRFIFCSCEFTELPSNLMEFLVNNKLHEYYQNNLSLTDINQLNQSIEFFLKAAIIFKLKFQKN